MISQISTLSISATRMDFFHANNIRCQGISRTSGKMENLESISHRKPKKLIEFFYVVFVVVIINLLYTPIRAFTYNSYIRVI